MGDRFETHVAASIGSDINVGDLKAVQQTFSSVGEKFFDQNF